LKFWVDMDNAPHVHVLRPIIVELERRGHRVEITARDYGQTLPLLGMYGLRARRVGRHRGKNIVRKYLSFIFRSLRLLFYSIGRQYDAVLCHGARAVVPAAWLLGLPLIIMGDYEHAGVLPRFLNFRVSLLLIPDVIPSAVFVHKGVPARCIIGFHGLKEDLYIHDFEPDASFIREMRIDKGRILVLVRPPATMAHYAVKESSHLFYQVLEYLCSRSDVQLLVLPRTGEQSEHLRLLAHERGYNNIAFPDKVYNGPSLIWHSDVVISGGGTMNREAAALGVPVISIYQGPIGAVDRHLIETGRLVHVGSLEDMTRIVIAKSGDRVDVRRADIGARLLEYITDRIVQTVGGA
jgi:predicted glycosyltransferase